MRTACTTNATLGAAALLVVGALLSGCSGATDSTGRQTAGTAATVPTVSTVSTTASVSQGASPDAPDDPGARVPDGTWTRTITAEEIARRGLDLAPEVITSNYLDDGSAQVVLKTQGARWSILIQDDAGQFEVGDLGDSSYDATGRWIQTSDSNGRSLLLVWKLDGNTLTTSGLSSPADRTPDDGERLFLEGMWQRQS